jgi:hypothetical protein
MGAPLNLEILFDNSTPIISRKDAKALGLKRYFMGEPCKHGHVAERLVSSRACFGCIKIANAAFYRENTEAEKVRAVVKRKMEKAADPIAYAEKTRTYNASNCAKNKEARLRYARNYYTRNRNRMKQAALQWARDNPEKINAKTAARKSAKLRATPPWLTAEDHAAIKAIYKAAAEVTRRTGQKHHVDHIYPLKGKTSCGLHVPWNLQVLPHRWNCEKHNADPIEWIDVEPFEPGDAYAIWRKPDCELR